MSKHPPKQFKRTKSLKIHRQSRPDPVNHNYASRDYANQPNFKTKKAIFDTLKYRQVFDCSMTYFQLWNYLISDSALDPVLFNTELANLVKEKRIVQKNGTYSLNTVDYEKAEKRKNHALKLLNQLDSTVDYLKQIPWIEMVAVTGSVAAFNANDQADIDILVVTKPKRLFLSRFFLVSTLKLLDVYWKANKPAGTVCPNILMTSDNLIWAIENQNLYTANEVSLIYPVFSRNNCYLDFVNQNSWIAKFLPNVVIPEIKPTTTKFSITSKLIDVVELGCMGFQKMYMHNKKTTELVSKNFIHFNVHNHTLSVLQKFHNQGTLYQNNN